ncbi:MAG TPA: heavy metal sensor histidine kinase [Burkholderiales bacterium]
MSSKSAEARFAGRRCGSLRLRLGAAFALIASAAIAAVGLSLYLTLASQLEADERAHLESKAQLLRQVLAEVPDRSALRAQAHRFSEVLGGNGDLQADVMDEGGMALLELSSFAWPLESVRQVAAGAQTPEVATSSDGRYRFLLAAARLGDERAVIGITHDTTGPRLLLSRFATSIVLACASGSLLAWLLGWMAAARGLAPLARMAQAAKRIGPQHLGERLNMDECPAELREVAGSFNQMLAGLEDSFVRLSQFSADLAHELRTPIGNLMLHAQVALGRPRSEAELRAVLESGLEELERLSRMVSHMLFLAKADHAQVALKREPVSLDEEVDKVLEFFEPLASERGLSLARRGTGRLSADRNLIRRLLANLVSNAVRHADEGTVVEVSVRGSDGAADIAVTNEGRHLSEEDRRRVFDRFYRGAASDGVLGEGAGLGLSIVKSIVQLHGGQVAAMSSAGRNTFSVTLLGGQP